MDTPEYETTLKEDNDNGDSLRESVMDARELYGKIVSQCLGEPRGRVVTATVLATAWACVSSGMNEEDYVTYVRQQFSFVRNLRFVRDE